MRSYKPTFWDYFWRAGSIVLGLGFLLVAMFLLWGGYLILNDPNPTMAHYGQENIGFIVVMALMFAFGGGACIVGPL